MTRDRPQTSISKRISRSKLLSSPHRRRPDSHSRLCGAKEPRLLSNPGLKVDGDVDPGRKRERERAFAHAIQTASVPPLHAIQRRQRSESLREWSLRTSSTPWPRHNSQLQERMPSKQCSNESARRLGYESPEPPLHAQSRFPVSQLCDKVRESSQPSSCTRR